MLCAKEELGLWGKKRHFKKKKLPCSVKSHVHWKVCYPKVGEMGASIYDMCLSNNKRLSRLRTIGQTVASLCVKYALF